MKRFLVNSTLALMTLGFGGCEWIGDMPVDRSYEEKIVLNGLLIAGTPIDSAASTSSIRLHRSADITEPYDDISVALSSATVTLDDGDSTYELLRYETLPRVLYHPTLVIETGRSYTIQVSDDTHDTVTATTTVPSALAITEIMVDGIPRDTIGEIVYQPAVGDSVGFLKPVQFSFQLSPDDPDNPPAMARLVNTALEASPSTMITEDDTLKALMYKWQFPSDSIEQRIYFKRAVTFNSVNFDDEVEIGWTFLTFYGWQNLSIFALDEAYYHYHKGHLEGPPSDSNYLPESNVVRGYGLFSSANLGTWPNYSSMNWKLVRPWSRMNRSLIMEINSR